MNFVSYAQNFEDVMLWRALKHVKNGFYVDVGAAWPEKHSVTKAFYDRGWHGINIEPNPIHFLSLKKERERDINLQTAVGEYTGEVKINFIGDTGLSTLDEAIAIQHKNNGWSIELATVKVQPLSRIMSMNVQVGKDIHFLKIDIEGFERQALQSHDWVNYRPWIVLVEATLPMSQKDFYVDWEPILLDADYIFVYADGLNRFYVEKEHAYMMDFFKYPPNVFDGFVLIDTVQAESKAEQAQEQAMAAESKAAQAQEQAMAAESKAAQAQEQAMAAEAKALQARQQAMAAAAKAQHAQASSVANLLKLQEVYDSASWRITAPLRWFLQQFYLLLRYGFKLSIKEATRELLRKGILWIIARPKLKIVAEQLASKLRMTDIVQPFVNSLFEVNKSYLDQPIVNQTTVGLNKLSNRSKFFYFYLMRAREKSKKGDL